MKTLKRIVYIIIGIIMVLIWGLIIFTPIVNDNVAKEVAQNIKDIELPEHTEYIEFFSKAGKLAGNGNGMQYLGGISIKSDCSLQDLQAYYSQYDNGYLKCIVEQPATFLQHYYISLSNNANENADYIVYSWGSSDSVFAELDIRGH